MNKLRLLLSISTLISLLAGCGDLDMALSSNKVYKVNAKINGLSFDECAILSSRSEISPYFDFNIKSDPDISALGVYLKDKRGKETGLRIIYLLPGHSASNWDTGDQTNAGTTSTNEESGDKTTEKTDSGEQPAENPDENSEKPSAENATETPVKTPAEISEASEEQKEEPPPAETSGHEEKYIPAKETENSGADITTYASSRYSTSTATITVEDLYELPVLTLGQELPAGFYTIVFDVIASNGVILNSVEKPFYYLANDELKIKDIAGYLPGFSATTRIVPPGEKVLLEAVLEVDAGVKPYVVWYNGKEKINEGFVSSGANRIFWTAPAQNGFQNIRVEVFPFDPVQYPFIHGVSQSVSLPVSERHGREDYYTGMDIQLSRWYRLWGNLKDSRDPASVSAELSKIEDTQTRWLPVPGSYGISIGAHDSYELPGDFFRHIRVNEGSGELLFRFLPAEDGDADKLLLTALLQGESADRSEKACVIQAALGEQALTLRVFYNDEIFETQTPLMFDKDNFVSAALDFQFFETTMTVSLGLESPETKSIETWERVSIDFAANGAGSLQFGGAFNVFDAAAAPLDSITATLSETAALYPAISPAVEPLEEEADETESAPEKTATDTGL
ncbi:MAG: MSCRAMM family adhesin SdrC [Spirochaetaceae bacterium]|jgi:hypothetical protein|nr:MSCRAMM family adhesin SdrC [Spirochaetaceae bacterium]